MKYPILQFALGDDSLICASVIIKQLSTTTIISTNLFAVLVMTPNCANAISDHSQKF